MSMPAICFTASEEVAKSVHLNHTLPQEDVAELSSVDTLKLSTLWAIIDDQPWDVKSMDEFGEIYSTENEWLHRIPDALTKKLAGLEASSIEQVSKPWAETEEIMCEPSEAAELIRIIGGVARRSMDTHRALYLYTSL